jgi:iron only hydrogenase large subunit-like protein
LILNVILIGVLIASHESDQVGIPPNHPMEDANWVHGRSRWKCKINGCTDIYTVKWLLHQHLDNKHMIHMEVGKYGCPSICVGGPRQQNHRVMNTRILSNPHATQKQNEKKALD